MARVPLQTYQSGQKQPELNLS